VQIVNVGLENNPVDYSNQFGRHEHVRLVLSLGHFDTPATHGYNELNHSDHVAAFDCKYGGCCWRRYPATHLDIACSGHILFLL
jgi:hypothetical protein